METRSTSSFSTWRHFPWLLGLMLSPLLFGAVNADGQAAVGALIGLSFFLLAPRLASPPGPTRTRPTWTLVMIALVFLPFIPLPIGIIHWIAPQKAALALAFPGAAMANDLQSLCIIGVLLQYDTSLHLRILVSFLIQ